MAEKEKIEVAKKQRSGLSFSLAKDHIGSTIRGQDIKVMEANTRGYVDVRSFFKCGRAGHYQDECPKGIRVRQGGFVVSKGKEVAE